MNVDLIRVVAQNTRRQRKRIHEILPAGIRQILDHLVVNHVLWSNRVGVDRLRPCDDFDFLLQSFGDSQREFHGLARFESYFGRRLEITFAAYRDAIGSKGKSIEAESPIRLRLRVSLLSCGWLCEMDLDVGGRLGVGIKDRSAER